MATADEAWEERWATPEVRADWLVPHPAVATLVPVLKERGTHHVLDLGCGVGRHALLFAEHGFAVEAIDGAAAGLDFARCEAAARGRLTASEVEACGGTVDRLDGKAVLGEEQGVPANTATEVQHMMRAALLQHRHQRCHRRVRHQPVGA